MIEIIWVWERLLKTARCDKLMYFYTWSSAKRVNPMGLNPVANFLFTCGPDQKLYYVEKKITAFNAIVRTGVNRYSSNPLFCVNFVRATRRLGEQIKTNLTLSGTALSNSNGACRNPRFTVTASQRYYGLHYYSRHLLLLRAFRFRFDHHSKDDCLTQTSYVIVQLSNEFGGGPM